MAKTKRRLKIAYIAGPFTGETTWDIAQNVRRAEELALEVAKLGVMPLIPHANTHLFFGQLTEEFWLAGTVELLERCDIMVLLPNWEASAGARAESARATMCGIPVFGTLKGVAAYMQQQEALEVARHE